MGSFSISMSFPRHGYYAGRSEGRTSLLDEGSSSDERCLFMHTRNGLVGEHRVLCRVIPAPLVEASSNCSIILGEELICPSLGQLRNLPVSYVHSMNLTWHKLRSGSHKIDVLI